MARSSASRPLILSILCVCLLSMSNPIIAFTADSQVVIRVYSKTAAQETLSKDMLYLLETTGQGSFDERLAAIWKAPELLSLKRPKEGQRGETELPWRIQTPKRTPFLKISDDVFVSFSRDGSPLTVTESAVKKVELKVNGEPKYTWTPQALDYTSTEIDISLYEIEGVEPASRVEVEVALENDKQLDSRNFILYDKWVGYSIADKETYLWFPVSIFSTNFSTGDKGMPFAALPISIAGGIKRYWPKSSNYVGGSLFTGLVWAPTTGDGSENNNTGEDIFLSRASVGLLLDWSGYLYVGGAYITDFRRGEHNPGASLVVGIGPRLLAFLQ